MKQARRRSLAGGLAIGGVAAVVAGAWALDRGVAAVVAHATPRLEQSLGAWGATAVSGHGALR